MVADLQVNQAFPCDSIKHSSGLSYRKMIKFDSPFSWSSVMTSAKIASSNSLSARIAALNWQRLSAQLSANGFAVTKQVLSKSECNAVIENFADDSLYRKVVDMDKHGFGRGIYKYFSDPLPSIVQELRTSIYEHLVDTANAWSSSFGLTTTYPPTLKEFLDVCKQSGQTRPTPLVLRYEPGDFNCLHQDKYGDVAFPLQVAVVLNERSLDYTGGEFVLVEQIPRAQSKASVLAPERGELIIFTNQDHPVKGKRGFYRAKMRHGVSKLYSGIRYTLGIIFHDAE